MSDSDYSMSHKYYKLKIYWLYYIKNKQVSIDVYLICAKRLLIYDCLQKKNTSMSTNDFTFKASRGWFAMSKKRNGIQCVIRHEEKLTSPLAGAHKH